MAVSTIIKNLLSGKYKRRSGNIGVGDSAIDAEIRPDSEPLRAECSEPREGGPSGGQPFPDNMVGVDCEELARRKAQSRADKQRHRDKLRGKKGKRRSSKVAHKPQPKPKLQPKANPEPENLEGPTTVMCNCCGRDAILMTGDQIYQNRMDLSDKYFWVCEPCDARVGTHMGTTRPVGKLSTARTRAARMEAHAAFDLLWRYGRRMKRDEAYKWMREALSLSEEGESGIGYLDEDQCKELITKIHQYLGTLGV